MSSAFNPDPWNPPSAIHDPLHIQIKGSSKIGYRGQLTAPGRRGRARVTGRAGMHPETRGSAPFSRWDLRGFRGERHKFWARKAPLPRRACDAKFIARFICAACLLMLNFSIEKSRCSERTISSDFAKIFWR